MLTLALLGITAAHAQAPGEDPVVLNKKLVIQMLPTSAQPQSTGLDGNPGMPAWLRARVARYEASAYATNTQGVQTDNDVVTTANAQGMQKTCVQEVGSNTTAGTAAGIGNRYGPNNTPQIVVLKGDLVNVCK